MKSVRLVSSNARVSYLQKHGKIVLKPDKNTLYKNVVENATSQNKFLKYSLSTLELSN